MNTETIITEIYDAWRAQNVEWLGTYLPADFCHMVYIPKDIHPLGGLCQGKAAVLQRLTTVTQELELLAYDPSDLLIRDSRAGLEIAIHHRHRATGIHLKSTIANFWTFEDGWPVKLDEYHDIERVRAFTAKVAATTQA